MSLAARLLNVFAIPRATFEDVRVSRHSIGTWILPLLLAWVVGTATVWLTFCQPGVLQDFRRNSEERIQRLVAEKKMTQSNADKNLKFANSLSHPQVARSLFSAAAAVISALRVFGWAFLLWLLATLFLKVRLDFLKALEVAGLASMITVLGNVVALALTTGFQAPANAATITIEDIQARAQSTLFIIQANVFNIWFVTLLAAGLACLAGVRLSQTLFLVMGTWLATQLLIAVTGLGAAALAG